MIYNNRHFRTRNLLYKRIQLVLRERISYNRRCGNCYMIEVLFWISGVDICCMDHLIRGGKMFADSSEIDYFKLPTSIEHLTFDCSFEKSPASMDALADYPYKHECTPLTKLKTLDIHCMYETDIDVPLSMDTQTLSRAIVVTPLGSANVYGPKRLMLKKDLTRLILQCYYLSNESVVDVSTCIDFTRVRGNFIVEPSNNLFKCKEIVVQLEICSKSV